MATASFVPILETHKESDDQSHTSAVTTSDLVLLKQFAASSKSASVSPTLGSTDVSSASSLPASLSSSPEEGVTHGFSIGTSSYTTDNDTPSIANTATRSTTNTSKTSALDALASLASSQFQESSLTSDLPWTFCNHTNHSLTNNDAQTMPPPPPRATVRRMRSASNPEGMEKWDTYKFKSFLSRELQQVSKVCNDRSLSPRGKTDFSIYGNPSLSLSHHVIEEEDDRDLENESSEEVLEEKPKRSRKKKAVVEEEQDVSEEEEIVEADLEPEELLRRARAKLLDDLNNTEHGLEKGAMAYPHSLDKYKEVYNKNGRIGIYTPAERAAIIAKFNSKRTRRTWKKKIRYNCRKNLADRRKRVKGRFVKREDLPQKDDVTTVENQQESETAPSLSPLRGSPLPPVQEDGNLDHDEDMPDVNDAEAGFKPTESQPFRRTRRHTIT